MRQQQRANYLAELVRIGAITPRQEQTLREDLVLTSHDRERIEAVTAVLRYHQSDLSAHEARSEAVAAHLAYLAAAASTELGGTSIHGFARQLAQVICHAADLTGLECGAQLRETFLRECIAHIKERSHKNSAPAPAIVH